MTAIIKANCSVCGEVELTSPQVTLNVYEGEDTHLELADLAYYEFECPDCDEHVERPASELIRFLLVNAECPVRIIPYPLELLETHHGAPIGWDDLIDFHQELENL